MGNQPNRIVRWAKMAADEAVFAYETIRESGSDELNYIIDIITAGYRPGKAVPNDKNTDSTR